MELVTGMGGEQSPLHQQEQPVLRQDRSTGEQLVKLPYLDGLHFRLSCNGAGPVPEEPTEASVNRLLEQMAYHEAMGVCWLVPIP